MFELKRKFVKIKKIKQRKDVSKDPIEEIVVDLDPTRCLACDSIIRKGNSLVCTGCLDTSCERYEKQALENDTRRKK